METFPDQNFWDLKVLVFCGGREIRNTEKNPSRNKVMPNKKLSPLMKIGTRAKLVRDEHSNHSLIPASGYAPVASK